MGILQLSYFLFNYVTFCEDKITNATMILNNIVFFLPCFFMYTIN